MLRLARRIGAFVHVLGPTNAQKNRKCSSKLSPRALPSSRVPISRKSRRSDNPLAEIKAAGANGSVRPPGPIPRVHGAWRLPSRPNSDGPSKGFCVLLLRCLPAARGGFDGHLQGFLVGRKRLVRPRWAGRQSRSMGTLDEAAGGNALSVLGGKADILAPRSRVR